MQKRTPTINKYAAGENSPGFFTNVKNNVKDTGRKLGATIRNAGSLKRMGELPIPDAASQFLGSTLYGNEGVKWVKENQGLANALTFIGIPSLIGAAAWGLGSLGSKKPVSPWPYLLPFAALGGTAWWLTKDNKVKDLMNKPLAPTTPPPAAQK